MKYQVSKASSFIKDLKQKLDKKDTAFKQNLLATITSIGQVPPLTDPLTGNWKETNTYKVKFSKNPEYRILYQLQACPHCAQLIANTQACKDNSESCVTIIIFVYFKTREECNNLYKLRKKDIPIFELPELDNPPHSA